MSCGLIHLCLDGTGGFQKIVQLRLFGLEIGIAANVLLGDEDVGHGSLAGDFLEGVLESGAVFCGRCQFLFLVQQESDGVVLKVVGAGLGAGQGRL